MTVIEEQIAWWKRNGYDAADAWDALGGSGLKLIIQWDSVRDLMKRMIAETKRAA